MPATLWAGGTTADPVPTSTAILRFSPEIAKLARAISLIRWYGDPVIGSQVTAPLWFLRPVDANAPPVQFRFAPQNEIEIGTVVVVHALILASVCQVD